MTCRLGFMQGRLSPPVNGQIQAFPVNTWEDEFPQAQAIGLTLMEWTLDQHLLYQNPLMNHSGRTRISSLCSRYLIQIPSLTGDCFMQHPFWKTSGTEREDLQKDFLNVLQAVIELGISIVVVPLVDNGRINSSSETDALLSFLLSITPTLSQHSVRIAFESDYPPAELKSFISQFPDHAFGINYDTGNSASLGYNPRDEFESYGSRIINVHIKDRPYLGTTVPLGHGDTNFSLIHSLLQDTGYSGNLILQTARCPSGNHSQILAQYTEFVTSIFSQ